MKILAYDGNKTVSFTSELFCSADPSAILTDIHTAADMLCDIDCSGTSVNGAADLLHRVLLDLSTVAIQLADASSPNKEEASHAAE